VDLTDIPFTQFRNGLPCAGLEFVSHGNVTGVAAVDRHVDHRAVVRTDAMRDIFPVHQAVVACNYLAPAARGKYSQSGDFLVVFNSGNVDRPAEMLDYRLSDWVK